MSSRVETSNSVPSAVKTHPLTHLVAKQAGILLMLYLAAAYLVTPLLWEEYAATHPRWADVPRVTRTGDRHPGDPLNVAIIGTETEVKRALLKAGWFPADSLTMKSCLEIAEATVLDRKYEEAPVSSLFCSIADRTSPLRSLSETIRRNGITFDSGKPLGRGKMASLCGSVQPPTTNASA